MSGREIVTPSAVINLDRACANVKRLVEAAAPYGIAHRPHIKVHKCPEIAKEQIRLGAKGITCAKLAEAEAMAAAGIGDILLAFPLVSEEKWNRYAALAKSVRMTTVVNSVEGARGLSETACREGLVFRVLLEIDGGMNRGGLKPGQPALDFARSIQDLSGLALCGLLHYDGNIYSAPTEMDMLAAVHAEQKLLTETAGLLAQNGFVMEVVSGGSSYSSKYPQFLQGLTEVRAGNYIFNDCAQLSVGLVQEDDCALRVHSTVVAKPDDHHVILDAGSKTLSSDKAAFAEGYGYIVGHPELRLWKLNEEHGFVEGEEPISLNIGDVVQIIPNHACVVTNLCGRVYGCRQGQPLRLLDIAARAMNY